ncbi:MAG: NUDIX domain-containing protein [Litoreibacter sp.]|uniref:NUDIX domain-containing protein n=1 Tax=Litoreibacter sp. TaxID=1969459 RepID=UPI003297BC49
MTTRDMPADVVLFGTLTDPELLEIVLGDVAISQPVVLENHQVFTAAGESFPLLLPRDGVQAHGLLLEQLSHEQVARLDYYEAPYGYALEPVVLAGGREAQVYRPSDNQFEAAAPWELSVWQDQIGAMTREAAHEIMGLFGRITMDDLLRRLGPIRARAQARVNAKTDNIPVALRQSEGRDAVSLTSIRRPYSQFFAVDELDLSHPRFDGGTNQVERAVFIAVDASVILPYDPVRDTVMLIEQFRPAPYVRGDMNPWMLEAVAGRIDGGETPEESAHRETQEEVGLSLKELLSVANYYPSPGAFSEYLYCFLGLADIPDSAAGHGGLASEGEDIRSLVIPFETLMGAVRSGEVQNGPLLICALYLERERDRLRKAATDA